MDQAINLKHKIRKVKTSALKLGINKICVSSIRKSMIKDQVLSNYDVLPSSIVISKKEEARIARKKRRSRQQLQQEVELKATNRVTKHRLALLRNEFESELDLYNNEAGEKKLIMIL